jgi:hypothetical protein
MSVLACLVFVSQNQKLETKGKINSFSFLLNFGSDLFFLKANRCFDTVTGGDGIHKGAKADLRPRKLASSSRVIILSRAHLK